MKKLITLLLLAIPAFGTTTVSGNMKNLGTGAVGQGNFVRFILRGCGNNTPRVTGTGVLQPQAGNQFYFDVQSDANGNLSGTLYSTRASNGTGNGDIECGGSYTSVWYGMEVHNGSYKGPEIPIHAKSGSTLDISNVTPITTLPTVIAPTGDSTYLRLDGGNSPVTGDVVFGGSLSAKRILGCSTVYAGGPFANIQAAVTDAGTTGCVFILANYAGVDTYTNPNNINIVDLRSSTFSVTHTGVFTNTQMNTNGLQSIINSTNIQTEFQWAQGSNFSTSPFTSAITSVNGVFQANAGQFFAVQPGGGTTAVVGVYGQCHATGAFSGANNGCWGSNFLAGGTTGQNMILYGSELDVNAKNVGDQAYGLVINGASTVSPTISEGILVDPIGPGQKWAAAYATQIAASNTAFLANVSATGVSQNSQTVAFNGVDGGGVARTSFIFGTPNGGLDLNSSNGQPVIIGSPNGLQVVAGGVQVVAGGVTFNSSLYISQTAPTIAGAGCGGSSASIVNPNGTAAFDINVGTAPTSGGCTVTMPAAANAWSCQVNDYTTISTSVFVQKQTASTTTSVTFQNYSDVAAATAPTANDVYHVTCGGH